MRLGGDWLMSANTDQADSEGRRLHAQSGFLVCPLSGKVWTRCGSEVGRSYKDGYVRIIVRRGRRSCVTWYVHRLVWEVVHGPIAKRMEIDHLDGDTANNMLKNLELVTGAENRRRQRERSLARWGGASSGCKLTEAEVKAVLRTQEGVPASVWARRLGVNTSLIRSIRQGRLWKHLACGSTRSRRSKRD